MSAALRYFLAVLLMFSAVIATSASVDGVRFAASPSVVQMRIEVFSSGATVVYDSGWREGNVFDWSAATLPYGSYAVRIFTRDLEGRTAEKQATLRAAPEGVSVDGAAADLKLTTTLHDGETGQLVTTSGDLSFRFGDFLNRKDAEVMRLTAQGDLDVAGLILAGQGSGLPHGSIHPSAASARLLRMPASRVPS